MKALRRSNTSSPSSSSSSWIQLRSLLVVASTPAPDRGSIKSPWSQRKRKNALSSRQWNSLFLPDGKLRDGGVKFLRKARRGGIDPSIRASVWPFLLGVYDLNSTEADRSNIQTQRRAEYEKLRRRCRRLNHHDKINRLKGVGEASKKGIMTLSDDPESLFSEDFSATSFSIEGSAKEDRSVLDKAPDRDRNACEIEEASDTEDRAIYDKTPNYNPCNVDGSCHGDQAAYHKSSSDSGTTQVDASAVETESSCSESSGEEDDEGVHISSEGILGPEPEYASVKGSFSSRTPEDFATWWRIIRLDALRINAEWVIYSPNQATISKDKADQCAEAVGMKDYDHLEPCMVFHAARLVALLEAYALYDPEIGYCQGMSDLLSPILAVIEDDHEAFWCFVGFMRKARHNFRLDEVGIRRQLGIVAKIIKSKDLLLYKHLENLQAEDCFFLYRMVVVLFRRELSFEQTVCLWEVMWADQTAIRAGISKSSWGRIRLRAPPTDDLLLYAIAACVLQRRKLIIQKYSSMDEIIRECNDMAGQLDVWRLLDDAHDLVVTLHDRI